MHVTVDTVVEMAWNCVMGMILMTCVVVTAECYSKSTCRIFLFRKLRMFHSLHQLP